MDPCETFPTELSSAMLALLPHNALYNCTFVSYRWNILASPLLWASPWSRYNASWSRILQVIETTTPLFPASSPTSEPSNPLDISLSIAPLDTVPPYLAHRYGTYVKCLNFSQLYYIVNDNLLQHLAERCPNLSTLIIDSPKQLTDCAILTIARSPCARALRHVALSNCTRLTDDSLTVLLAETPQLYRLELNHGTHITDRTLRALPTPHSSLEELDCTDANSAHVTRDDGGMETSGLYALVKRCTELRTLRLGYCQAVTDVTLAQVARACGGTLRTLNLASCRAITDTGLKALVGHGCKALEELDVSGCSVTDEGILAVVEGCILTSLCVTSDYGGISRDCLKKIEEGVWREVGLGLKGEMKRKVKVIESRN
ncbi:hypothetical protein BC937DRAFT_88155 [Endogone sp. FLAS-F59071]|nr:hypothetical protein BC937DRAFT_88155 [Endogone sp. FLAS-F59071]|eukprot:RUS18934.1 hypothetical protein BC937DRAFT_88155 [Endogone sp. FLAS-F59071]